MGIIKAFNGALTSTFADQWLDIFTAGVFTERTVISPAIIKSFNNGRGSNYKGSEGVITNGSKIYVPENTAAYIFSESGIEDIITEAGGYEYTNGQESVMNGDGIGSAIFGQISNRFKYGGIPSENKKISFVNLREISNIRFGTRGPQVYNDLYYGTDLEIMAFGSFSIKVTNPTLFIKNFVPPNVVYYTFDDLRVRNRIVTEFLQSFSIALNSLSSTYRISQLASQKNTIADIIQSEPYNAGTWEERFGFKLISVSIENIEFTEESRELVRNFSSTKMGMKAYDNISQQTSNIAAQQKIAEGIRDNGLGNGGGMIMGVNVAQALNPSNASQQPSMSLEQQIESLKKLKELVDAGILTQEEFETKKKQIMGL